MAVSTTLSAGLVAIGKMDGVRVDLLAYLFGDLLSISSNELPVLAGTLGCCFGDSGFIFGVIYY
jgi:zinc transport system permease protein